MSTFFERYQKTLAFKERQAEELVDLYFHRRIAAAVAAVIYRSPITPNQVTLIGVAVGALGSLSMYQGFFVGQPGPASAWLWAAFFLFASVILDCVDGQLARARGGGSRVGRILDGVADCLVLLPAYVIVGFGILELFGLVWFVVACVAGISTWIHCLACDKVRSLYLAHTKPEAGGDLGSEPIAEVRSEWAEARVNGSLLEQILLGLYLGYLRVQNHVTSGSTENQAHRRRPAEMERFRRRHRATMQLASVMGFGTHMFIFYITIALMAFEPRVVLVTQVLLATVFNALMIPLLWKARDLA